MMGWRSREAEDDFENQRREMERERAKKKPNPHAEHEIYREQEYQPAQYTPQKRPLPLGGPPKGIPTPKYPVVGIVITACSIVIPLLIMAVNSAQSNTPIIEAEDYIVTEYADWAAEQLEEEIDLLRTAKAGDFVPFGSEEIWQVLEQQEDRVLLFNLEASNLQGRTRKELLAQMNETDETGGYIWLGQTLFSQEEYRYILETEVGEGMKPQRAFLLTPEQMEQYGVEQPEDTDPSIMIEICPAIWVSTK